MSAEKKNIFKKVKDYVLKQDGLYPVSRDTSSDTVFMGNSNASDVNTLTTVIGDGNYTSYDAGEVTDALYSDSVIPKIVNNESFTNVMPKLTRIVNNVRYLVHALGSTDISAIGDGTITGALSTLNSNVAQSIRTSNIDRGKGFIINRTDDVITMSCVDANNTGIEIDFCYGYGGLIQLHKMVNGQSVGLKVVGLTET